MGSNGPALSSHSRLNDYGSLGSQIRKTAVQNPTVTARQAGEGSACTCIPNAHEHVTETRRQPRLPRQAVVGVCLGLPARRKKVQSSAVKPLQTPRAVILIAAEAGT